MTPSINGKLHHFEFRGLYDGVSLLGDRETGSLWHHVTGESLHGPLRGTRLPSGNLLHMTVKQALAVHPDIAVALSERPLTHQPGRWWPWLDRVPVLGDAFRRTMSREDTRRPALDVGLGVWTSNVQRYYPLEAISAGSGIIVDVLDGRRIVIARAPGWVAPMAWYVTSTSIAWDGDVLRGDSGEVMRDGVWYGPDGTKAPAQQPMQLFTRWYGYALMFPRTEIYRPPNQ